MSSKRSAARGTSGTPATELADHLTKMLSSIQVSCVQMHWARPIEENLERTLHYVERAAMAGSRVVLFPEANLTSYYFPYLIELDHDLVQRALDSCVGAAQSHGIWVIVGTIRKTPDRFLNVMHVISPE